MSVKLSHGSPALLTRARIFFFFPHFPLIAPLFFFFLDYSPNFPPPSVPLASWLFLQVFLTSPPLRNAPVPFPVFSLPGGLAVPGLCTLFCLPFSWHLCFLRPGFFYSICIPAVPCVGAKKPRSFFYPVHMESFLLYPFAFFSNSFVGR